MAALGALLLFLVLGLLSAEGRVREGKAVPMKKFTVDLDKPPEERWIDILSHYNSSVPFIIDYFDEQVPKLVRELLDKVMGSLDDLLGELGQEMRAVANYWQIDLGIVVTLNFIYELRKLGGGHPNTTNTTDDSVTACTSIVAQDQNGNVFLGRNLDWNLPNDLRNTTVLADFLKGGEVIFTADVTAGFVGVLTGMSKNGFSVSINERNLGGDPVVNALEALLRHAWSPTHLARKVLTSATSYAEAVEMLKREPLTAPTYFITAGSQPNEGAVITRDRNFLRNFWPLSVSAKPNSWYLLETNYDHWKSVDPYDNRRYYGNLYMQAMGQEKAATMEGIYSVLSKWPIRNNDTTYTTVMNPKGYSIESYDVYK